MPERIKGVLTDNIFHHVTQSTLAADIEVRNLSPFGMMMTHVTCKVRTTHGMRETAIVTMGLVLMAVSVAMVKMTVVSDLYSYF
jgi:hypothetical protein